MPLQNMCMTATTTTDQRDPSKVYGLDNAVQQFAPGAEKVGAVWAISAETGQTTWKHEQRAGRMSLVATGGGLIFGGDDNGRFRALGRQDRQSAVGDEPRFAGQRLSRHVCRRRQTIRCRDHRPFTRRQFVTSSRPGIETWRHRQCFRVCASLRGRISHELNEFNEPNSLNSFNSWLIPLRESSSTGARSPLSRVCRYSRSRDRRPQD